MSAVPTQSLHPDHRKAQRNTRFMIQILESTDLALIEGLPERVLAIVSGQRSWDATVGNRHRGQW